MEITPVTPQSQIDAIALALANRFLSEVDAGTTVDAARLTEAVKRAGELTRHTIFLLAQQVRQNNWDTNKPLMERTIPIFQVLVDVDRQKHYYFGQLAYAQRDRAMPDWKEAMANVERAIELLGSREPGEWPFYDFIHAVCAIALDPGFTAGKASAAAARKAILHDLGNASRGLHAFDELIEQPQNASVRKWLTLNGSPKLS